MLTGRPEFASSQAIASGQLDDAVSLIDVLRWRAANEPDEVVFRFLADGESETCVMTWWQLEEAVRNLAVRLQECGLAGERVVLLFRSEPEFITAFLACLYVGAVAVPLAMPRPNRSDHALRHVIQHAAPRAVLSTSEHFGGPLSLRRSLFDEFDLDVIPVDSVHGDGDDPLLPLDASNSTLAYLQYTSGSTSDPKGVMVTHGNVAHNCRCVAEVIGDCGTNVGCGWLPHYHDMGLVGTILLPMWMGFPVVLMPPEAFIMKPVRWLQAISKYRATISPAPDFAFDLCVRRVDVTDHDALDLTSWRIAFNGAEPIDARSLQRFAETFAGTGFRPETFYPCYGLAESTMFVTGGATDEPPVVRTFDRQALSEGAAIRSENGRPVVGCGWTRTGLELKIVEPESLETCSPGQVGEIMVSGASVAAGYWGDGEKTSETFLVDEAGTRWLRTGDLGIVVDGHLYITGRRKDLIIIGGRNIAPEDIEHSVEVYCLEVPKGGAMTFSVSGKDRERVVTVAEVERRPADRDVAEHIERTIRTIAAEHNNVAIDEIILVRRRTLPRTPNGKKQRSACRRAYLQNSIARAVHDDSKSV